jgi:hypothetical protein
MRNKELDLIAMAMSNAAEISGRVAANEAKRGLLADNLFQSLRCIAGYGAFSLAIALVPLQRALANSDDQHGQILPSVIVSSTVPANGDLNPYGVAFVPEGFPSAGPLKPGDILVSNFNDAANVQGTGTTIIKLTPNGQVAPSGSASVFFQGTPPLGLTTALGVLKRGFVLVGNVPTTQGSFGSIQPGSLLILDSHASVVLTLTKANLLDSPWDLTIQDRGDFSKVFVSNVVSGTVTRVDLAIIGGKPVVVSTTQIAKGYTVQPNQAAVILGPTGLAYDAEADVLYVASTADNAIFAVPNAAGRVGPPPNGTGTIIFQDNHLRGPLALVLAPNGHLITSNGDAVNADVTQPSELVEFTKDGKFVGESNVDAAQGGAFGIAITASDDDRVRFAAVDDNASDIIVHTFHTEE